MTVQPDPTIAIWPTIAQRIDAAPEAAAIWTARGTLRYGDLGTRAQSVAASLSDAGVRPGGMVGVYGGRSAERITAMVGVLAMGGVVVPLDPDFAPERLSFIIRDAGLAAILCTPAERERVGDLAPECPVIVPSDASAPAVTLPTINGEDPAFLLYTSGSTGTPKGVLLPQRALTTYEFGPGDLAVTAQDTVLYTSTPACDGMLPEAIAPLLRGATVAVVEGAPVTLAAVAEGVDRSGATVMPVYAGLLNLLIDNRPEALGPLRMILCGGEAMSVPRITRLMDRWPHLSVVNEFGPTETCIASLAHVVQRADLTGDSLPIGRPLTGETVMILDDAGQVAPPDTAGELAIGGMGVALGYHNLPDRTAASFVPDPRPGQSGRVYLTGDRATCRADGTHLFHGRQDRQMKIAGRRVELDGVEAALVAHQAVKDAVVEAVAGPDGRPVLAAFILADQPTRAAELQAALRADPDLDIHPHVFPRHVELLDSFPLTRTGKIDRTGLRARVEALASDPTPASTPTSIRDSVTAIWRDLLGVTPGRDDSFFDLGGTSLQLIEAHARIESTLDIRFDIATLFDTPRLGDFCAALEGANSDAPTGTRAPDVSEDAIAVVGMAARLPGLRDLDDFWDAIVTGRSTITRFAPDELEDSFDAQTRASETYVPARSILTDVDRFDAQFFGMMPAEAARIDPQGRIFLEICQEALDDAGLDPTRFDGRVGLYTGASMSTYLLSNLLRDGDGVRDFTSGFQIDYTNLAGNVGDDIPSRAAQKLGLTGPAMSITTACSTGLVAVIEACGALRGGRVRAALAGGVSISFPQRRGYLAQEGGMASLDGVCRPFDANANGTVFGDGAGVVVLKRLQDALDDGDTIHAVVRGTGLSNDGGRGMSYTAPSVSGQAEAIVEALRDADVDPADLGYVECHGTATPLGDPVEIAGLKKALGPRGDRALGAVKGTLGHLDAAAGIAGFIKTVLVLRNRVIPPVPHFRKLNPNIDLDGAGLRLPDAATPWVSDRTPLAGVSAFGVGGSNAHVVLSAGPDQAPVDAPTGAVILPLSAKTPEALIAMGTALAEQLEGTAPPPLADVARTLQQGRRIWTHRGGVVASTPEDAARALRRVRPTQTRETPRLVALMPGQGAQYPGMARTPYETSADFARSLDEGLATLPDDLAQELRHLLLDADPTDDTQAAHLAQTWLAQPALLLTELAMARLWAAWGAKPDLYIGHSVGEIAAAVLSGVMSEADALRFVARRGALMQSQPAGGMTAVQATPEELAAVLTSDVDLAACNSPDQQVVAGAAEALDAFEAHLTQAGITHRRLRSSHAFHSRMMDAVVPGLLEVASDMTLRPPTRPILSTVTGQILSDAEATDPAYWAGQARACVDYRGALDTLADGGAPAALLEIGPGRTLTALAAQCLPAEATVDAVPSLPDPGQADRAPEVMATAALRLWSAGLPVDLSVGVPVGARKTSLPSYPFDRQRCWIDADPASPPVLTDVPSVPMTQSAPSVLPELLALISEMTGMPLGPDDAEVTFLELGLDSLFLGQLTQEVGRTYKVQFGFRRLTSDLGSPALLAAHIDAENPHPAPAPAPAPVVAPQAAPVATAMPAPAAAPAATGDLGAVMQAQVAAMQTLFTQQLAAMGGQPAAASAPVAAAPVTPPTPSAPVAAPAAAKPADAQPAASGGRRLKMISNAELTDEQRGFARDLAVQYSAKFPTSKSYTDEHRPVLADPRTAAGFHADWKELAFPIVAERAKGAYIYDLDGNDLVDLVNGFGQTAFGHSPDFVSAAVAAQLEKGYALGPQAERAGPLAEKFARAVGHERVSFCNTGTEAVIAAVRAARTATGREKVVLFDKSYHGQHDEVLVKPGMSATAPTALPSAPGIPRGGLGNVVVLPFASEAALAYIRDNLDDLAAVVIEPVRSRYPATRPEQFVRDIKAMTDDVDTALIIDEVVTGFRTDARGMQGVWNLQGDMAIYGKVVGGGLPIGIVAGNARYLDALDGGTWRYGDDSRPEAMPTFVAGTFVRHPLVLAAVEATLDHMAEQGDRLWVETPKLLADMASRMRAALAARGLPDVIEDYSSWLVVDLTEADPRATLLYPLMRMAGVHVLDGFCWFLTTEHTQADCDRVVRAFEQALDTLLSVGILAEVRDPNVALPAPKGPIPLTASQREIWMRHQLGGLAAAAFNESGTLMLDGTLDLSALQTAVDGVVARRDALRLRFEADGSGFTVTDPAPVDLHLTDLSDRPEGMADIIADDAARPFDLTAEAPIRVRVLKLGEDRHAVILTAHHIVLDGWSFGLCLDDLAALYAAARTDQAADLPAAPDFADHARRGHVAEPNHAAYWRETFATVPDLPELPTDRPRQAQADRPGATVVHEIPRAVVDDLKKIGAKHGCTLFTATFAAMQALIHRLSGATDIVIGVPTAAQQSTAGFDLVGHCVNFLPIRSQFDPEATVGGHLTSLRDAVSAALDHDGVTFGEILDLAQVPRRLDRLPLTEVEFNLEEPGDLGWPADLAAGFETNPKAAVTFDLFFNLVSSDAGLRIEAHYAIDLFDAATIRAWAAAYEALLRGMARDAAAPVATLPLTEAVLPPAETGEDLPAMTDLLAGVVAERAEAVAVETDGPMTYADLWARSGAYAAALQTRGVAPGDRVGVNLPRGAELIPALLGVLRTGAAFVPLDPRQPDARLAKILSDAAPKVIVSDTADRFDLAAITPTQVTPSEPSPVQIDGTAPAYVIYTSGSTGTPKGVEVPHKALTNLLQSMAQTPGLGPDDRLLAVTTAMFDISILELFGPLLVGARVVIAPTEDVVDGFRLAERLGRGDITVMQATPTLWSILLTAGFEPAAPFRIWAGGEPLARDLAERLMAKGAALWNLYGPTETTIWSAASRVEAGQPITIGQPIARTELQVLDANGQPTAPGVPGELNIGGAGLALGYAGQPQRTSEAFRDVTLGGQSRKLYATGDMARQRADGTIEVLGRRDGQVKLRGFRIDLGEVEAALRAQPTITHAAVDLRTRASGDAQLVGYVVGERVDGPALMRALAQDLPDYMVPTAWVALPALPQTANGKLDRKALPMPETGPVAVETATPPATSTETRLTAIWAEVLGSDTVDVTASLLALGADSLTIFRLAARLMADGMALEARHLFDHPSIRALAAFYDGRGDGADVPKRPQLRAFRGGARRRSAGGEA